MPEAEAAKVPYHHLTLPKSAAQRLSSDRVGVMELNRIRRISLPKLSSCFQSGKWSYRASASRRTKCLQGRLFSYGDAQRYRLWRQSPPDSGDAPRCPCTVIIVMALCAWMATMAARLGYEPNSYGEWQEQPDFRETTFEF